jgi:adenosine deaminase
MSDLTRGGGRRDETRSGVAVADDAAQAALDELLLRLPKVELHVHLEGSMPPATLLDLARRRRVDLPVGRAEEMADWFRFRDFDHFVQIYLTICRCLKQPEDFQELVDAVAAEQARQNVVYSEFHFTIGTHLMNGHSASELRDALAEALVDAERRHGVRLRLIPDIVRNVPFVWADRTLEWALEMRERGVVALGLSGVEATHPNEPFVEHFRVAGAEGLRRVAHAGEHAGPQSVRSVRELLGAERIAGVRAIDDPELVGELAEGGVPLEVCPTSNLCLGVAPDLAAHPFERLRREGCVMTVNSDDPPLFATTLTDEYRRLARAYGYGAEVLGGLALGALRSSFLAAAEKERLEHELRRNLAALGEELLGRTVEPVLETAAPPLARG